MNNLSAIPGLLYFPVNGIAHLGRTTIADATTECGQILVASRPWHHWQPPNTVLCTDCLRVVDALQFNAGGQRQRG